MVWAHLLSNSGALTNPFDYREILCASVGWDDRTVEQVEYEQEKRAKERERRQKAREKNPSGAPAVAGAAPIATSELQKMRDMLAGVGLPRPEPVKPVKPVKPPRKRKPKAPPVQE